MRRAVFSFLVLGALATGNALAGPPRAPLPPALAPTGAAVCPGAGEAGCMLDAIWRAASRLPDDKRARLRPAFADSVEAAGDASIAANWQGRLGGVRARAPSPDYARQTAQQAIAEHGWQGFVDRARQGAPPLNIGRPEIMAAALDLAPDAAARADLAELMFLLAGSPTAAHRGLGGFNPDMFERADFGHVLAERMMKDCDGARFAQARRLTAAPESIRYELWAARINGGAGRLAGRIALGDGSGDTSFVRQALEGYTPVMRLGYCGQ